MWGTIPQKCKTGNEKSHAVALLIRVIGVVQTLLS
jgi:hypothetical protein